MGVLLPRFGSQAPLKTGCMHLLRLPSAGKSYTVSVDGCLSGKLFSTTFKNPLLPAGRCDIGPTVKVCLLQGMDGTLPALGVCCCSRLQIWHLKDSSLQC